MAIGVYNRGRAQTGTQQDGQAEQRESLDLLFYDLGLVAAGPGLRKCHANQDTGIELGGVGDIPKTGLVGKHAPNGVSIV